MLFALTSASRSLGIHNLDIEFMVTLPNEYKFTITKLNRSWRMRLKKTVVVFPSYLFDDEVSPCFDQSFKTLGDYLNGTKQFREESSVSQVLSGIDMTSVHSSFHLFNAAFENVFVP